MAVTLHDVAHLAGVSIKTVSNVVNNNPGVRPATRKKVEKAVAQLGYRPNLSARNLRSGRSGVIGLVVPQLSLSYFAQLADAVIRRADEHGLITQIEQTGGDRDRELAVLDSPRARHVDGIIFSPLGMSQDDVGFLNVSYPLVLLGERIFGSPVDHVTMRNIDAAQAATEALLDRGRRRIAIVGAHEGEVVGSAALRFKGYLQALNAAGLPLDEALVGHAGLWHQADGAHAIQQIIDSGADFDGVFAMNDSLALGAMSRLQQTGRRVPEDVSVIGFDNIEEGKYSMPSLTTIDPGRDEIARTVVDLLVERIERSGQEHARREVLVDFALVQREST